MTQSKPDPVDLAIVASILSLNPMPISSASSCIGQALELWEECCKKLQDYGVPAEKGSSLPANDRLEALLARAKAKPVTFNAAIRAVIGGSKLPDRMKLLRDFLRDCPLKSEGRYGRLQDAMGDPPSPEECIERMRGANYFTAKRLSSFASEFSAWKPKRDSLIRSRRAKIAAQASALKRKLKKHP